MVLLCKNLQRIAGLASNDNCTNKKSDTFYNITFKYVWMNLVFDGIYNFK